MKKAAKQPPPGEMVVSDDKRHILQRVAWTSPLRDGGCVITFQCGHHQKSDLPAGAFGGKDLLVVCVKCSKMVIWNPEAELQMIVQGSVSPTAQTGRPS